MDGRDFVLELNAGMLILDDFNVDDQTVYSCLNFAYQESKIHSSRGVRIALDDFGTGFSSVGLVKNLPFDTIKIDRSFVKDIEEDELEKKLLECFTGLAGIFGPAVCVEGIETSEMCNIIRDYGIHSFQGFYYSKPISIKELVEKVKDGAECFAK